MASTRKEQYKEKRENIEKMNAASIDEEKPKKTKVKKVVDFESLDLDFFDEKKESTSEKLKKEEKKIYSTIEMNKVNEEAKTPEKVLGKRKKLEGKPTIEEQKKLENSEIEKVEEKKTIVIKKSQTDSNPVVKKKLIINDRTINTQQMAKMSPTRQISVPEVLEEIKEKKNDKIKTKPTKIIKDATPYDGGIALKVLGVCFVLAIAVIIIIIFAL